jgi:hypothetical protein
MSTVAHPTDVLTPRLSPAAQPETSYLGAERTVLSWVLTTDHKRIGVLYLFTTAIFLALGGAFAMVIRIEHLTPGATTSRRSRTTASSRFTA